MDDFPILDDRQKDRIDVDGLVKLKILFTHSDKQELQEIRARVINMSPGGLCIEPEVVLEKGVLADLILQLEGVPLANTLGIVRWCDPEKGIGLEFFYGTSEEREALEESIRDSAGDQGDLTS